MLAWKKIIQKLLFTLLVAALMVPVAPALAQPSSPATETNAESGLGVRVSVVSEPFHVPKVALSVGAPGCAAPVFGSIIDLQAAETVDLNQPASCFQFSLGFAISAGAALALAPSVYQDVVIAVVRQDAEVRSTPVLRETYPVSRTAVLPSAEVSLERKVFQGFGVFAREGFLHHSFTNRQTPNLAKMQILRC